MIASLTSMLISTAPLPSHLPSAPALPSQPPEWNSYVLFLPLRSFLNQKKRAPLREILCNVVSKCTLLFCEFAYILRNISYFRSLKIVAYLQIFVNLEFGKSPLYRIFDKESFHQQNIFFPLLSFYSFQSRPASVYPFSIYHTICSYKITIAAAF